MSANISPPGQGERPGVMLDPDAIREQIRLHSLWANYFRRLLRLTLDTTQAAACLSAKQEGQTHDA